MKLPLALALLAAAAAGAAAAPPDAVLEHVCRVESAPPEARGDVACPVEARAWLRTPDGFPPVRPGPGHALVLHVELLVVGEDAYDATLRPSGPGLVDAAPATPARLGPGDAAEARFAFAIPAEAAGVARFAANVTLVRDGVLVAEDVVEVPVSLHPPRERTPAAGALAVALVAAVTAAARGSAKA